MGMDVYGVAPTDEVGEYFRNSAWSWRPLWDYVCKACDIDEERHQAGHFNDGHRVDQLTAKRIAKRLRFLVEDGYVEIYRLNREAIIEALPAEKCVHCEGTGQRDDEHVQGTCNGCGGTGTVPHIESHYTFSEENVQDFADFADHSGGFEIC